jgi:hypothetical protein
VRTLLFEECGNNLPLLEHLDQTQLERFHFSTLKLSKGELDKLEHAIALAKADCREFRQLADDGSTLPLISNHALT